MSGYLYRGRHSGAERPARPSSTGPTMDSSAGDTDRGPPAQTQSLREFEQHLNDLKKENFSLKLRIYFLEEKIQEKFEESSDGVHRRNIELKVEVESLKKDLEEKQQQLDETLSSVEHQSSGNEAELRRRLEGRQQEISHTQGVLKTKVQVLQEEAELARDEAQRMTSLADSEAQRRQDLEREMEESRELSQQLLDHNHRAVEDLKQRNQSLSFQVDQLQVIVRDLSSPLRKPLDQRLVDEQRGPLTRYKGTAGQCVAVLQRTQDQKLQQRLREMELQLKSAQEDARRQERTIQNITDVVNSKEEQVLDLRQLVEEQKKMLSSLRELDNSSQIQASSVCGQEEVMVLQASLFQAQLELQASERVQLQAIRNQDDLRRALQRLETDLLGALQHRREAERHNKDLQAALEKTQAALQEREEQLTEGERDRQRRQDETEETIMELKACLLTKEQLIKDCELLEDPEKRNSVLEKLRQRIKERDRALERAVDEKFHCVDEKEAETRRLQLLLREKERDIETQRRVLNNNQETITSLEVLLRGKVLELEQVRDAWRNIQRQQQDSEEGQSHALRERDAIISHLQGALHASTQEAQDGFSSLLGRIQSAPSKVLEDLKVRLQLKDRLLQEVLADRTCQAQQHQEQVQDLLRTISSRDQYIQESASRLGEVMAEQTARLQELRRQLSSGAGSKSDSGSDLELQAVQEELRLALRRERENQELSRSQAIRVDLLSRELLLKEETIRDLQRNVVDSSGPPLVEQLTQEVQELRENLIQLGGPPARGPILGQDRHESGEPSSEGGDEADEDVDRLRVRAEVRTKGLIEVRQLVEQKKVVERQLVELKVQLQKAGFSSLSQMRKALFSLRAENGELKHQMTEEEEEEEEDVTIEGVEKDEEEELWETWDDELHHPSSSTQVGGVSKQRGPVLVRSKEQQGSLMVSEARVRVRKDTGVLLPETAVQQDSKQVQVDLQDPGYETCGRSENEAEREDTSSPEFDDLEMCTALDCGSQWWPATSTSTSTSTGTTFTRTTSQSTALEKESSLQRLVEDLRSQLSRSQAVIRGLQNRLRSLSTSSDYGPSAPRKVNWSFQASPAQSGTEDDEGWQSSDGGLKASARHRHSEPGLQELVSRVDALEEQLRNGGTKTVVQDGKAASWPGRFDSLIQAQARELSHLRQRLKEGLGFCSILSQQLVDTTKTFEELLRSNDVDYYMGQNFREQLAQSSTLAQRLATKISIRDQPEDPEEKTELLAIRLSKELQQKDQIIESLRAKLNQHHHHRSDTPTSSHAFSDATDQSDRISYVSDERGSTNDDLEAGSDVDTTSENAQKETSSSVSTECLSFGGARSCHSSVPPSISSSHTAQSWLSFPNMHCSSSPHTRADVRRQTGRQTAPASSPAHPQSSFNPREPPPTTLTTCYQDDRGVGFSLADVHQELQMLQRQLGDAEKFSSTRSGPQGVPVPLTLQGLQPFPLSSSTLKSGASLLEGSALWDMAYGRGPVRLGADLSSGSSGYQTGPSHTGSDLMREHLGEIRSLRQRLEDSIQTNERLRLQLEDRLARTTCEKGAPTNIYIQGLDSVGRVSTDIRLLKEENLSLQNQLKDTTRDGAKEAERLREEALLQRARLTEAVLEAERWAEQSSKMQTEAEARSQEIVHLKQDRQKSKDTVNRVQHEVMVLQQQLAESHRRVQGLQEELQVFHREQGVTSESGWLPVRNLTSPHGLHAVAYIDDLTALRQQVQEGGAVLTEMEENLGSEPSDLRLHVKLLSDAETLRRVLDQVRSLLLRFWIEAPPTGKETKQETSLQEEVFSLRLRLSEQDRALTDAMERVESSNRTKDSMERFIVSQLSRTRDVLRRAKTNLQVKNPEDSGSTPSLMVRDS